MLKIPELDPVGICCNVTNCDVNNNKYSLQVKFNRASLNTIQKKNVTKRYIFIIYCTMLFSFIKMIYKNFTK